MKPQERGILIGLALALVVALLFVVLRTSGEESDEGAIDDRRLPPATPLRSFKTEGGVEVLVIEEGRGEERQKGEAMDIAFVGYIAASGARFQQNIKLGWVLEDGGVIQGWIEGLAGMKRLERRRLRIPPELGYGAMRQGNIMPNSALVFDVQWAVLDSHDLAEGSGDEAKAGDTVTVFYKGMLENGDVFDTNVGGDSISFPLRKGSLIDGWVLGVPGMRVGGKRRLWVPWHLAYDSRARPGRPGMASIKPYSNLVFEIELMGVK
ncbi:MAG: FKBP-type peptidyl-prolyl cis-trans isomerase [Planctomycetota bacterium]|nr:FKBP-type peptidyl-prolyl cis-trans isomerase [Planctomycetota bacterium]